MIWVLQIVFIGLHEVKRNVYFVAYHEVKRNVYFMVYHEVKRSLYFMADRTGLEPAIFAVTGRCVNQTTPPIQTD
jgi:hypothetical protein